MNWNDTIGQVIKAQMIAHALKVKPEVDREKLLDSIARTSVSVGITRHAIADVMEAEIEALAFHRALGNTGVTIDYLAGWTAATDLVRKGKHAITNDNDSNDIR
jgi:hypothetical protein